MKCIKYKNAHYNSIIFSSDVWQQTKFSTVILSYAILIYQPTITVLVPQVTNTNILHTTSRETVVRNNY